MSDLRIETLKLPGADLGPKNPLPVFHNERELHHIERIPPDVPDEMRSNMGYGHLASLLPYQMQDGYTRELVSREFRVAVLENEILKAIFLMEYGGRLWSLYHKTSQRELLTVNPVFQPANLALRNAWFSGGVEWNIGTIGHSPFTCSPMFVAHVAGPNNLPILRMYEWERIRQTPFQIDVYLPEKSPVLFVRIRICNPHNHEVPMYWWSNIAVPETKETRVIVPAEKMYFFNYEGLEVLPMPEHAGQDKTYPSRIDRACDFFFHVPDGQRSWIAALDGQGQGLVQVSTDLLRGRKLFVWGMGAGGRKWQNFLSPSGDPYIEIQAGLARTQLEHVPMPANAEWTWLEAYGLLEADSGAVHSPDWELARRCVSESIEELIPRTYLEKELADGMEFADKPPAKILQSGSGWGVLESLRRKQAREPACCPPGMAFDSAALNSEQIPWETLLRTGEFSAPDPEVIPSGLMVQAEWKILLEEAIRFHPNWFAWMHLGVMRYYAGQRKEARQAWNTSLAEKRTPWVLRNLAVLSKEEKAFKTCAGLYIEAVQLTPDLLPLAVECGKELIAAGFAQRWLELLPSISPGIRTRGRIRLLEAQAGLQVGELKRVEAFFANRPEIDDNREGEQSLSQLWLDFHAERIHRDENVPLDDALFTRVRSQYPIPPELDFRMADE